MYFRIKGDFFFKMKIKVGGKSSFNLIRRPKVEEYNDGTFGFMTSSLMGAIIRKVALLLTDKRYLVLF